MKICKNWDKMGIFWISLIWMLALHKNLGQNMEENWIGDKLSRVF